MSKRKKPKPRNRPGIKVPKGYQVPKMGKVQRRASHEEYMLQVVTLRDTDGKVIHRGTRRECVQVSRRRYEEKMKRAKLAATSKVWR